MRAISCHSRKISGRLVKSAMKDERVGMLYLLFTHVDHVVSLVAEKNEKTTLWHKRFGHLSENGMRILQSKDVLIAMKDASFDFCENCVFGK